MALAGLDALLIEGARRGDVDEDRPGGAVAQRVAVLPLQAEQDTTVECPAAFSARIQSRIDSSQGWRS